MKKIVLLLIAASFLSCGASKLVKETERSFNGEWILNDISYPNSSGFFDVILFQTANANCFESSVWNFVANNNRGTVDLYDTSCTTERQNLVWSVEESTKPDYLYNVVLKMAENEKARKEKNGSRLQIKEITPDKMIWDLNIQFQSKPMIVRLHFVKN